MRLASKGGYGKKAIWNSGKMSFWMNVISGTIGFCVGGPVGAAAAIAIANEQTDGVFQHDE